MPPYSHRVQSRNKKAAVKAVARTAAQPGQSRIASLFVEERFRSYGWLIYNREKMKRLRSLQSYCNSNFQKGTLTVTSNTEKVLITGKGCRKTR